MSTDPHQAKADRLVADYDLLKQERDGLDTSPGNPDRIRNMRRVTELIDQMYDVGTALRDLVGEAGYDRYNVPRLPVWS